MISAYAPSHYIDNVPHDFGSVLRFIEGNFAVQQGALNFADARASNDLQTFFNYSLAPRQFSPIASPRNAAFFINDTRPVTDPDDDQDK